MTQNKFACMSTFTANIPGFKGSLRLAYLLLLDTRISKWKVVLFSTRLCKLTPSVVAVGGGGDSGS